MANRGSGLPVSDCCKCSFASVNGICLCALTTVFQQSSVDPKIVKEFISNILRMNNNQNAANCINHIRNFVLEITQNNLNKAALESISHMEKCRKEYSDFQHDQAIELQNDLHRNMDIEERYEEPSYDILGNRKDNDLNYS